MTLTQKLQKSFTMADEEGYETYRGLAYDKNDPNMFNSKEEIDKYFEESALA